MFLSEWREFPSVPCLAGKTPWWQLASRCCWNRARPWHAYEFVSFLAKDLSAPRYTVWIFNDDFLPEHKLRYLSSQLTHHVLCDSCTKAVDSFYNSQRLCASCGKRWVWRKVWPSSVIDCKSRVSKFKRYRFKSPTFIISFICDNNATTTVSQQQCHNNIVTTQNLWFFGRKV